MYNIFGWLSLKFVIFSCEMRVTCESSEVILCLETRQRREKNFISKEKSEFLFFSNSSSFVFSLYILISSNLQINMKKKLHNYVDLKEVD